MNFFIACNIVMLKPKKYIPIKSILSILSLLLLLTGCASQYTVLPSKVPAYSGEANRHVRWIRVDSQQIFQILTSPQGINPCARTAPWFYIFRRCLTQKGILLKPA